MSKPIVEDDGETVTIKYESECEKCEGTGLYIGMCERDGSAVVCHNCKGTGKFVEEFEYKHFDGRKKRGGVKRVYQISGGYVIGEGKDKQTGKVYKLEDFGGIDYKDWLNGKGFGKGTENRMCMCPAHWGQSVGSRINRDKYCKVGFFAGFFSDCKEFKNKDKCWELYDKESKGGK